MWLTNTTSELSNLLGCPIILPGNGLQYIPPSELNQTGQTFHCHIGDDVDGINDLPFTGDQYLALTLLYPGFMR